MNSQNLRNCAAETQKVISRAQVLSIDKDELRIKVTITNNESQAIYLATEPKDQQGRSGFYISLDDKNLTELIVSSRVYPSPIPSPPANNTLVKLKKLSPNEIYEEMITLRFPLKETIPPKGNLEYKFENGELILGKDISAARTVNLNKIKSVNITFGYFLYEKGIENFLMSKPQGWFIRGNETVSITNNSDRKSFLEIQNLTFDKLQLDKFE